MPSQTQPGFNLNCETQTQVKIMPLKDHSFKGMDLKKSA